MRFGWTALGNGYRYLETMLTVNAENHELMRRFHKPGAEKRSVIIVRPSNTKTGLGAAQRTRRVRS